MSILDRKILLLICIVLVMILPASCVKKQSVEINKSVDYYNQIVVASEIKDFNKDVYHVPFHLYYDTEKNMYQAVGTSEVQITSPTGSAVVSVKLISEPVAQSEEGIAWMEWEASVTTVNGSKYSQSGKNRVNYKILSKDSNAVNISYSIDGKDAVSNPLVLKIYK